MKGKGFLLKKKSCCKKIKIIKAKRKWVKEKIERKKEETNTNLFLLKERKKKN